MIRKSVLILLTTLALAVFVIYVIPVCIGADFDWAFRVPGERRLPQIQAHFLVKRQSWPSWGVVTVSHRAPDITAPRDPGTGPASLAAIYSKHIYLSLGGFVIWSVGTALPGEGPVVSTCVATPMAYPFIAFLGYPLIAFIRGPLRRWRRRRRGLCIRCGYNLGGNVSGTCSECGEAKG